MDGNSNYYVVCALLESNTVEETRRKIFQESVLSSVPLTRVTGEASERPPS